MKQKGFTLIELLAVIVILAIIAVITVPMIMNVIDKAKIGALEDSAYGMIESANLYYSENVQNLTSATTFDFVDGKQTSEIKLKYSGNIDNGKLILNTDGKIVVCIDDGANYAYKELNETKVTSGKGTCSYNGETGNFTIVSDVDSLNQELNDLKKIGNALSSEIIEGKTALVGGLEVTGTMKNNSGVTVNTTNVSSDVTNTYFTVPESGYYDTNSIISAENMNLPSKLNYVTGNEVHIRRPASYPMSFTLEPGTYFAFTSAMFSSSQGNGDIYCSRASVSISGADEVTALAYVGVASIIKVKDSSKVITFTANVGSAWTSHYLRYRVDIFN